MGNKHEVESSNPATIRLTLEKEIEANIPAFWRLVHNSSKMSKDFYDGEPRKCYTRVYELMCGGEPTGFGVRFFYDYRDGGVTKASFDAVAIKALQHQITGDYKEQVISDYIKDHQEVKKPFWIIH